MSKRVEELLKKFYVPEDQIEKLLAEDAELSDEEFEQIVTGASSKYQKHFEAEILPTKIEETRNTTYSKSTLKFIKSTNRKLNLGMTNAEMEAFEDIDSFMAVLDEKIEEQKAGLRDSASDATVAELTTIKKQYSELQDAHDLFVKSHEDKIAAVEAKKKEEVESALGKSKYAYALSKKKVDMEIPGIKRTLVAIENELYDAAKVDRDGKVTAKDGSPLMINGKVVEDVDEYLNNVLEHDQLLIVNNASREPSSTSQRRRRTSDAQESDAVRRKREELEASRRRSQVQEKPRNSRF